jgi:hypothetical protein
MFSIESWLSPWVGLKGMRSALSSAAFFWRLAVSSAKGAISVSCGRALF